MLRVTAKHSCNHKLCCVILIIYGVIENFCVCVPVCCRYDYVSPGEAQGISFARLFFHHPQFASELDMMYIHTHMQADVFVQILLSSS